MRAKKRDVDLWKVQFSHARAPFDEAECPDCLSLVPGDDRNPRGMKGIFAYYWSFGVDAEVAYRCARPTSSFTDAWCRGRVVQDPVNVCSCMARHAGLTHEVLLHQPTVRRAA